jgi:hypothetical protein
MTGYETSPHCLLDRRLMDTRVGMGAVDVFSVPTNRRLRAGSILTSYYGGLQFKSCPGDRISWLRFTWGSIAFADEFLSCTSITSFYILTNLLITNLPITQSCIIWAVECIFKQRKFVCLFPWRGMLWHWAWHLFRVPLQEYWACGSHSL